MVQKINRLLDTLLEGLGTLDGLESVVHIPYQAYQNLDSAMTCLKLDVFVRGEVPDQVSRMQKLPPSEFLETSLAKTKDRFFLDGLSVHIDYKKTSDVETVLKRVASPPHFLGEDSTYGLFRLFKGVVILKNSPWIEHQKHELDQLPDGFWNFHRQNLTSRMEHQVSDLGSALFANDPFHFQTSLAHYLETVSELLFTAHHEFLCPPEQISHSLENLNHLPGGFKGLWDTLIRVDPSVDIERKLSVARRLAELLLVF